MYTEIILTGQSLEINHETLLVCKETTMGYAEYQWTFGVANDMSMEDLWTWENQEEFYSEGDPISGK